MNDPGENESYYLITPKTAKTSASPNMPPSADRIVRTNRITRNARYVTKCTTTSPYEYKLAVNPGTVVTGKKSRAECTSNMSAMMNCPSDAEAEVVRSGLAAE